MLIDEALQPPSESSANAMLGLLQIQNTANIVERYSNSDAMGVLRTNILDKDTWKFSILSKIDEYLGINPEESMDAWGYDYSTFIKEDYVYEMSQSTDYEDLDNAINELRGISSILGIDLDDSISELENHRDDLPPEQPDEDYERYSTSQARDGNSSRELDNVFASLLE